MLMEIQSGFFFQRDTGILLYYLYYEIEFKFLSLNKLTTKTFPDSKFGRFH